MNTDQPAQLAQPTNTHSPHLSHSIETKPAGHLRVWCAACRINLSYIETIAAGVCSDCGTTLTARDEAAGADGMVSSAKILEIRQHEECDTAFANRLGLNAKTVARWTKTERRIALNTADRIAHALDLHPLLIWGDEYTTAVRSSDPADVLDQISDLSTLAAAKRCGVSEGAIARWRTVGVGTATTIEKARRNLQAHSHSPKRPNVRK